MFDISLQSLVTDSFNYEHHFGKIVLKPSGAVNTPPPPLLLAIIAVRDIACYDIIGVYDYVSVTPFFFFLQIRNEAY